MKTPLLAFEKVTFAYRGNGETVLNELSLQVQPNTVTAILGPNGAGKTTLLNLALGWLKPHSGRVQLDGKPLKAYTRRELGQRIGLVPQNENISFEYSLLEYVLLGRAPYLKPLEMPGAEDFEIAVQALETVGLGGVMKRSVTALSGGERQLVLVARALVQSPGLLLMDEAASHLDLSNKIRLMDLTQELVEQGITVVLTTHEPDVAASVASHLVLMRAGRVEHAGLLGDEFTAERLSETYSVPVEVSEVSGRLIALWGNVNRYRGGHVE
ncbi:MAG: ABC transporter ATP-binding protein [Anaerolineaceae bacterium]|nr:ABC transporter ATP-binding protein [Anaerolineaceae bacterium]